MSEEMYWSWIERGFKAIPVHYILFLIPFFIIINLINTILIDRNIPAQNCNIYTIMQGASACFLAVYGIAGVQYFIKDMKRITKNIKQPVRIQIEKRFTSSIVFKKIFFIVTAAFIIADLLHGYCYLFFNKNTAVWDILLNLFNLAITLLIIYSMTMIIWIIFNISWVLNKIERSYRMIKIDFFSADKVGGLKPIRDLILKLVVFQFIAISIGSMSFLTQDGIIYIEIMFLIFIFIITLYFFVDSWYIINKLLDGERRRIINTINKIYLRQNQRMHDIISTEEYSAKEEKLDRILASMEFLQDERERVMHANKKVYNIKELFVIASSSLPSIITITTYLLPLIVPAESDGYGQVIQGVVLFNQHAITLINDFIQEFI